MTNDGLDRAAFDELQLLRPQASMSMVHICTQYKMCDNKNYTFICHNAVTVKDARE